MSLLVGTIGMMVATLRAQSPDWRATLAAVVEAGRLAAGLRSGRIAFALDDGIREELIGIREVARQVSLVSPLGRLTTRAEYATTQLAAGTVELIDGFLSPTVDLAMAEVALHEIEFVVAKLAGES